MRNFFYSAGGLLLVAGAVLPIFLSSVAPFVFALGAVMFAPTQMADRYESDNIIIRRLRRQQMLGALMLLVSAGLMLTSYWNIPPFRGSEWKMTLTIAAVIELYTIFRISHEAEKER